MVFPHIVEKGKLSRTVITQERFDTFWIKEDVIEIKDIENFLNEKRILFLKHLGYDITKASK